MHKYLLILTLSLVCQANELKIGLFELYPYVYRSQGSYHGVMIDFLNEVNHQTDLKFVYKVTPYPRLIESLKNDQVDIGILYPNSMAGIDKQKLFPTLGNQNYIISFKHKKLDLHLMPKTIGIIRGASYSNFVDDYPKKYKIPLKNYEIGIKMVKAKRLDYLMIPSTVLYSLCPMKICGNSKLTFIEPVNEKKNWVHATKHAKPKMLKKFRAAHDFTLKKQGYQHLHDLLNRK